MGWLRDGKPGKVRFEPAKVKIPGDPAHHRDRGR